MFHANASTPTPSRVHGTPIYGSLDAQTSISDFTHSRHSIAPPIGAEKRPGFSKSMSQIVIRLVVVLSFALRGRPVPTTFEPVGVQAIHVR
jgi:hypothetical protein